MSNWNEKLRSHEAAREQLKLRNENLRQEQDRRREEIARQEKADLYDKNLAEFKEIDQALGITELLRDVQREWGEGKITYSREGRGKILSTQLPNLHFRRKYHTWRASQYHTSSDGIGMIGEYTYSIVVGADIKEEPAELEIIYDTIDINSIDGGGYYHASVPFSIPRDSMDRRSSPPYVLKPGIVISLRGFPIGLTIDVSSIFNWASLEKAVNAIVGGRTRDVYTYGACKGIDVTGPDAKFKMEDYVIKEVEMLRRHNALPSQTRTDIARLSRKLSTLST